MSTNYYDPMTSDEHKNSKSLDTKMGFGKYKDKTVKWVILNDWPYMNWAVENIAWFSLDDDADEFFEENEPDFDPYDLLDDQYDYIDLGDR